MIFLLFDLLLIAFVTIFVDYFCLGIIQKNYFDKMIAVYNYCSFLEVVFLNYYCFIYFCLKDLDLFFHILAKGYFGSMFLRFILIILLFLPLFSNGMSISTTIIEPIFQ